MKKDGFILYKSFYAPVESFSDEQLGRLFRAIFNYQINGDEEVDFDLQMAFNFFKSQMDNEDKKYEQVVERNRVNGRGGGRPRKDEKPRKPSGLKITQKTQWVKNNPVGYENPKKPIGKDRIGKDITTSTSTGVEDTGVSVRENNITNPVEDQSAGAREQTPPCPQQADTQSTDECMARKALRPHKTLREDDAAGTDGAGISAPSGKTWREDFEVYKTELRMAYKTLREDDAWISTQQRFNPGMNIALSLEKACVNYWATEAAWKHKRKQKIQTINWHQTLSNALSQPQNKVYNDNRTHQKPNSGGVSDDFKRGILETLLGGGGSA